MQNEELSRIGEALAKIERPSELLTSLFAHTPVGLSLFDVAGQCVVWNGALRDLFGAPPPSDYNLFRDSLLTANGHLPAIKRALQGETVRLPASSYDPRLVDPTHLSQGRAVSVEITVFPLRDALGQVQYLAMSCKDVTLEEELRRSVEEQERARAKLTRLELEAAQMRDASRSKSEFVANMSHELRTPLNAILGFAELIAEGMVDPISPQFAEFMGHILGSGRQLLRMINDVLDLARAEAGRMEIFGECVSPAGLVDEVCALLEATACQSDIRLSTDCAGDLGEVLLDPARFKQVLFNYLSNALKFTRRGGSVQVRLRREGAEQFRLEVSDDGIGIADHHQSRIFVEFQQLTAPGDQRGGTGLGLALTRRVVEALGGRVGFESKLGEGSTFWALFPLRPASAQEGRPVTRSRIPAKRSAELAPRVLVIDDDMASRRLMESALKQLGYDPVGTDNATRGLTLADQVEPECIVIDLMMPGIDGFQLLGKLRENPRQRETPVIVWTMKDLSMTEIEALHAHAFAVITKGGDERGSLLAQLSSVLPKHAG